MSFVFLPAYNLLTDTKDREWEKNKPSTKSEREKLMELCGNRCFGVPGKLKFPICPKHIEDPIQCGLDCHGLLAAYSRAR